MDESYSYWIVSALVTLLGFAGLLLAAGAWDSGISVFGLALAAFAVLYNFFAIHRTHRD